MDTAARIEILRRSGFSPQTIAAIVGVDYAEVQQFSADPADVPEVTGGGGGAAVSLYASQSTIVPSGDISATDLPLGNESLVAEGIEAEVGSPDFDVPAGIYLVRFNLVLGWDSGDPAVDGFVSLALQYTVEGSGVLLASFELNNQHDTVGYGDAPIPQQGWQVHKMDMVRLAEDATISFSGSQVAGGGVGDMAISTQLLLTKI